MARFNSDRYYCILSDLGTGNDIDNGWFSSIKSAKDWSKNRGTMGRPYEAKLYKKDWSLCEVGSFVEVMIWRPKVSQKPNECGNPASWQTLKAK